MSKINGDQELLAFNISQSISGPENFLRRSIQSSRTSTKIPTSTTELLFAVSIIHETRIMNVLIH